LGKPWTSEENVTVKRMIEEGASIDEIFSALHGRTAGAVERQVGRLGLGQKFARAEEISLPKIEDAEILSREEALKTLSAAMKRLREGGKTSELEMERLRIIIAAVRNYFTVFDSYEKYAELEERIRRLETVLETAEKAEEATNTEGR